MVSSSTRSRDSAEVERLFVRGVLGRISTYHTHLKKNACVSHSKEDHHCYCKSKVEKMGAIR